MVFLGGGSSLGTSVETAELADGAVTDAKLASGLNGTGHIFCFAYFYDSVIAGTWVDDANTSHFGDHVLRNNVAAQNDEIRWKAYLAKGTYVIKAMFRKDTSMGIMTFQIDNVDVGTIDGYAASAQENQTGSITAISVTDSGLKNIDIKMATKNASASTYGCFLTGFVIYRSA